MPAFLVDSESERYLSREAISRLLRLLANLSLIEVGDSEIVLTARGRHALQGQNYNPTVTTAVLDYLSEYEIKLSSIYDAIEAVRRPDVPESEKIFDKLDSGRKDDLGFERFRMLLYLLYCTEKIDRRIKVIYGKRARAET
jgi:hypothetical protein